MVYIALTYYEIMREVKQYRCVGEPGLSDSEFNGHQQGYLFLAQVNALAAPHGFSYLNLIFGK
jgi:hypothetical protein